MWRCEAGEEAFNAGSLAPALPWPSPLERDGGTPLERDRGREGDRVTGASPSLAQGGGRTGDLDPRTAAGKEGRSLSYTQTTWTLARRQERRVALSHSLTHTTWTLARRGVRRVARRLRRGGRALGKP